MQSVPRKLFSFLKILKTKKKSRPAPVLQGQIYNLQTIYQEVNQTYFEGKLNLHIEWSGNKDKKARRSRRLGSYCLRTERIRIHRMLDSPEFPSPFIYFIVYHEMLHSVYPPLKHRSGRRAIHHPEFRQKEREFAEYEAVKKWEKENRKLFF